MCRTQLSYDELAARLELAESAIAALRGNQIDAVIGESDVAYVRLREVEDALRETTERLHDVLNSIRDAFVAVDSDWHITFASESAASIAGTSADELAEVSLWEAFPDLTASNLQQDCSESVAMGMACHYDAELANQRWISVSVYPASEGASIHWRDITERKQQEREREAQRLLLESLFEEAPFGIAVLDRDARVLLANPEMERLPTVEQVALVGRTMGEIYSSDVAETGEMIIDHVINHGERVSIEAFEYRAEPDSHPIYLDVQAIPLLASEGTMSNALVLLNDVTASVVARAQVEALADERGRDLAQLQAILDTMDKAVIIFEPDGRFVRYNPAAIRMLPSMEYLEEISEGLSHFTLSTLSGTTVPLEEWPVLRALRGETFSDAEFVVRDARREEPRMLSYSGAPICNEKGEMILGIVTIGDVTERIAMEERLRDLNHELGRQVAERTRLAEARAALLQKLARELLDTEQRERRHLSQVLHDHLQQLLTAAQMRAHLLTRHAPGHEEAQELLELLKEAIAESRSLAAELSPPVLARGLLPALRWLADQMLQKHHLRVVLDLSDAREPEDERVSAFLLQAAQELLFNAVKHAGVEEVSLRLLAEESSLLLEVADNGSGFDTNDLEAQEGMVLGTGILSIRNRTELLGGEMEVASAPGQGSSFRLRMPVSIRAAAGASKAVQPRLKLSGTPTETGGAPIRVLIVDDHDIVREGLVGLLSNYAEIEIVGEACDGATAVTMARELKPDVVLMDVTMPGIGGIEATRQIVTNEPSIRVIGLSMHEEQDVVDQMMRAGAVDYMNKGGPYDGLIATILGRADA